jgi:hypothetical protein
MKILFWIVLTGSCFGQAQPWSGIIATGRAIDWSSAGVPGGIPTTRTQCVNTQCATVTTAGSAATAAQINAALANAPANTYVLLAAGTYSVGANSINLTKDNVTLRGSGSNSTFLVAGNGANCALGSPSGFICAYDSLGLYDGNAQVLPPNGIRQMSWTAGLTDGSTSITLNSCGAGCIPPVVNQTIILDVADDPSDTSGLYICGLSTCNNEGTTNPVGRTIGGVFHSQQEIVLVCSISGSGTGPYTVGITSNGNCASATGIHGSNWNKSSGSPGAWWPGTITGAGIEDLSADYTANITGSGQNGITLYDCFGCWVKGVRGIQPAGQSHVLPYQSSHWTVQDSYFYGSPGAQQSYGVQPYESGDGLVQNNIFQQIASPFVSGNHMGTVVAYNFSVYNLFSNANWMQVTYFSHNTGAMFNLFESNTFNGLTSDDDWGTSAQSTAFRNRIIGQETVSGLQRTLNTGAFKLDWGSRGFNVIGNVIGTASYDNTYQVTGGSVTNCNTAIYNFGQRGTQCSGANDSVVVATLMRWGNYDAVNAVNRFDNTESSPASAGSGVAQIPANTTPASQTLPNSFFLTATTASACGTGLSWWKNPTRGTCEPFPAIGPDVSSGDLGVCASGTYVNSVCRVGSTQCGGAVACNSAVSGRANLIPAQSCYLDVMSGVPDGTGSVLVFNRNNCYANDPLAPSASIRINGNINSQGNIVLQ